MNVKQALSGIIIFFAFPAFVAAQATSKFPVSASSKVLGYGPLWAADKKGFFQREGLDVEVIVTNGTAPSMQALVAESIHATLAANDGVIGLVEKGVDLAIIAAGSKTTHMILGGKNIKSYEDLRGATLGSSTLTSGTAFLLNGLKTVVEVYAEQADIKGPISAPEKYVDLSYLEQALKEIGWR